MSCLMSDNEAWFGWMKFFLWRILALALIVGLLMIALAALNQ